jgi:glycosyltransferase involved in cell wall biosynthesis
MEPQVTVVIPVLNDVLGLRQCLAALRAQDFSGSWEVVVADNGSIEDVEAVVAPHARARLIREERRGSYAARNAALRASSSPVVAFTDADCVPSEDWLRCGLDALEARPEAGAVAGRIEVFSRRPCSASAAELYDLIHAFPQERYVRDLGFGVTANLFVRRQVLERLGMFDASLRSGGDAEWGQRATAAGFPVFYAGEVVVRHPARRSITELLGKTRRVIEGREELHHRQQGRERTIRREAVRAVRNTVDTARRTWRDPRLARRRDRLRVSAVGALVHGVSAREALRHRAG